jgi:hypothetical protein
VTAAEPVGPREYKKLLKGARVLHGVKTTAMYLANEYADWEDGSDIFPGNKRLAEELCCCHETIKRHMRWLLANGWLIEVYHGQGGQLASVYQLSIPERYARHAEGASKETSKETSKATKKGNIEYPHPFIADSDSADAASSSSPVVYEPETPEEAEERLASFRRRRTASEALREAQGMPWGEERNRAIAAAQELERAEWS